jgi:arylsulfatase A-like enzyme
MRRGRQGAGSPLLWCAAAALCAVALAGCPRHQGGARAAVVRLIESDPQSRLDRTRFVDSEVVSSWAFRSADDLDGWQLGGAADGDTIGASGLHLSVGRRLVTLDREVRLDAAALDAFELRLRGARRQPVSVEWAGPGESFSHDRRVTLEIGRQAEDGSAEYRLVTAGHPGWRGAVARLRFSIGVPKNRGVVVERISGLVETVQASRLAEAVARPWRIDLAGDDRSALLAVPGSVIRRTVAVPDAAELWLAYGVQPLVPGPVRFRVSVQRAGGDRRVLLDDVVAQAGEAWREATLDLSALAGETVELELTADTEQPFQPENGFPLWANPELVGTAAAAPPNLLLIVVDTLRADHLSLYGYPRATSPHFDAWAGSRGVVFERVVAPAPWTLPSHVSLFSGLDAHRHGVNYNLPAPASLTMMAELLREAGYATLAVTGGGFVHAQYGFAQGFDSYWSFAVAMGLDREIDEEVARACALLERYAGRPFFMFLHTYEVHNPYRPRQPFFGSFSSHPGDVIVDAHALPVSADDGFLEHRRLIVKRDAEPAVAMSDDQLDLAVDLYDAGIAHADAMLARVLGQLERLGIDRRTIVVVTSDHGEMFGEHGAFGHVSLYEENLLVPLIVVDPRRQQPRRVPGQVRLIDILPTALDLVGVGAPPGIDGASLVAALDGGAVPGESATAFSYAGATGYGLAVRERDRWKYVVRTAPWPMSGPTEWLYDLRTDPGEQRGGDRGGPELDGLRRLTAAVLAEEIPGVRVRIAAAAGGPPLSGRLAAATFSPHRVTALEPGCACLTWEPPLGARFEVAPGRTVDLLLVDVGPAVTVTLDPGRRAAAPVVATVPLATLDGVALVLRGGGPLARAGEAPGDDGVSLWWQRRPAAAPTGSPEFDQSLRGQLEALGYVE